MSILRRTLTALALLLGLAATAVAAPSAATAAEVPGPKSLVAFRVVLERTGGVTGQPVTYTVDAGGANPEIPRLLRVVSSADFLALNDSYLPHDPCCDFFRYKVTVSYTNDAKKIVVTMENANPPQILWDVIRVTEAIGTVEAA